MHLNLTINYFRHVSGTATGSKMAPSNANLFMKKPKSKFLPEFALMPTLYKRYIDNIFLIWTHSEEELLDSIDCYNSVHPNIHLIYTYSHMNINFVDVTVEIEKGKLSTNLYCKPTDRQHYFYYQSDCQRPCKNSVSFSHAYRFKQTCPKEEHFGASTQNLKTMLGKQKYPYLSPCRSALYHLGPSSQRSICGTCSITLAWKSLQATWPHFCWMDKTFGTESCRLGTGRPHFSCSLLPGHGSGGSCQGAVGLNPFGQFSFYTF